MLPMKTILCPTDFSSHSDAAFQLASALARDYGAKVVLLHVAPATIPTFVEGVMLPEAETPALGVTDELANWHPDIHHFAVERIVREGSPTEEILAVANELHCDMIVMGTHGRGPLRKMIMGSVAEGVTRKAPCPVLTVRQSADASMPLAPADTPALVD